MEIVEFAPQKTATRYLPWDSTLKIMPIGDLHIGADGFKAELLGRQIEQGLKDGCYFIGMGDTLDFVSSSNRERLINANLYDSARTVIDEAADRLVDTLAAILKPSAGRWLGMVEGNHFWTFDDGTTSDMALCRALKAPFLGTCGLIQARFRDERPLRRSITCDVWVHHGTGGGATPAGILNKLHRAMESFEADVYLMGHLHRLVAEKVSRLYCSHSPNPKIIERPKVLCGTGSFMAGYQQGSKYAGRPHGSYVERKILPPSALGSPVIVVWPKRGGTDGMPVLEMTVTQ